MQLDVETLFRQSKTEFCFPNSVPSLRMQRTSFHFRRTEFGTEERKLKINIANLKEGEHFFDYSVNPGDFGFEENILKGNVEVEVKLFKTVNQINAEVSLGGKLDLECDRCLDRFQQDFTSEFLIIFKSYFKKEELEEADAYDDTLVFIPANTAFIDLKQDIKDYILLSVPMRHVPPSNETEGKEICLFCNRNVKEFLPAIEKDEVNPIWEKLNDLKNKN